MVLVPESTCVPRLLCALKKCIGRAVGGRDIAKLLGSESVTRLHRRHRAAPGCDWKTKAKIARGIRLYRGLAACGRRLARVHRDPGKRGPSRSLDVAGDPSISIRTRIATTANIEFA